MKAKIKHDFTFFFLFSSSFFFFFGLFLFCFFAVLAVIYLRVAKTAKMVKNFGPILHNKYWGNPKKETSTNITENHDVYSCLAQKKQIFL